MSKIILLALLTGVVFLLPLGFGAAQEVAVTHGPLSGEVTDTTATLWARGSAAGTLRFEVSTSEDFSEESLTAEVEVDETSDFTGETTLEDLEAGTQYYYRVSLDDSDARAGAFKTAPAIDSSVPVNFVFGACLGGQGYCRDAQEGWVIFDTMAAQEPDFFILTGDSIYSDTGCPADQNVPGAETPAEDLQGYYARYRYHLEDPHYSDFLAHTPIYVTWDDHEIDDNFGGPELSEENPQVWEEGRKAYFDYWPIHGAPDDPFQLYRAVNYGANADIFLLDSRSYRDPLVNWDPSPVTGVHKTLLGAEQFAWLQTELAESEATWKFIVSSVPLAYPTGFPQPQVEGNDGWANGANPSGYETELMRLVYYIVANDIENVIFLTGDTHWPFAHSYDPDMDGDADFYEFSSSPMSAIPLAPAPVDQTFNPTVLYAEGEFQGDLFNFGQVSVAEDGTLTFKIIDKSGAEHFSVDVQPQ
jgi:alkaline phosphatase D